MGRVLNVPALEGIRVLEIGNYLAGPFCGMHFADLGADVVKVENPGGGDFTRALGPFVEGESASFMRLNRGKRSIALDLKKPEGAEVFRRLAASADILLENLRPGTMADLGLSPSSLLSDNERLVYVAISGWGSEGPYAERPALDLIVQAMSGLMSVTGERDRSPVKVGVSIADVTAALFATIATLAALRARERDGKGQFVDLSMLEASASLAVWESGEYFTNGKFPRANGSAHNFIAPYQAIRASDGHFILGATTPRNWTAFCETVGLQSLVDDPRFIDGAARLHNVDELVQLIEAVTSTEPRAHWVALLGRAGVPCAEIRDYGQVFEDEQLRHRGFVTELDHPKAGKLRAMGSALRLMRTPPKMHAAGPMLGEDSIAILEELGLEQASISRLIDTGTVHVPA